MKISLLVVSTASILSATSATRKQSLLRHESNHDVERRRDLEKDEICCNCLPPGRFRGVCTSFYAQNCDRYDEPDDMNDKCRSRYDDYTSNFEECYPGYVPIDIEEEGIGCRIANDDYICDCLSYIPCCVIDNTDCDPDLIEEFSGCWEQVDEGSINFRVISKWARMSGVDNCENSDFFELFASALGVDCN